MKIKFLFLFLTQICISQTPEVKQLLMDGEKAFLENNFLLAKEIYTKAVHLDAENKNCWYDLGVTELKLGENENACEHFYQAVLLYHEAAFEMMEKNCPDFRNGTVMFLKDVEEKPKFFYKDIEYELIVENDVNPLYKEILIKELESSKIIVQKVKERTPMRVVFRINKNNEIEVKVIEAHSEIKINHPVLQYEIAFVFSNMVRYVAAKNKGKEVDLWDKWILPLDFQIVKE
ncbi:hypothetical protein D0817_03725 [Flavobacterium cupreum]|uniref:Uncharacterized protein n=1 Tax=Flavobacterium cupreum TaxID=2133766 RepID=A0A434ABQ6_9FLAO|nr:hypothetical protein [Flavobacterium cupreum]RUT71805.1 hypothetical protein D0817_03725 [Flavobacterium cupreum]